MPREYLIISAGWLAVTALVWVVYLLWPEPRDRAAETTRIRVHGGYVPAEVHVPAGEPTRLVFRREDMTPCSERVVFPDYGLSFALPAFEDVEVELPAAEPGVRAFTCEMEMLRGRLVIDEQPLREEVAL